MAEPKKTASGKWRHIVTINYKQYSTTLNTKAACYVWEGELRDGRLKKNVKMTFGELLDRYVKQVSRHKKGYRWESLRIEKMKRDEVADIPINELSRKHFADWRDRSLESISADSVIREWSILNHCLNVAVNEWELLDVNPMLGVKKPKKSPPRDRLPSEKELDMLCHALNYSPDLVLLNMITSRVGAAMMFAIETAMRAQEICNLTWADIDGSVATINKSKTDAGVRDVPLSPRAVEIIAQCKGLDDEAIFCLRPSQIDSNFRKAKAYCMIEDLHFHDTRALAITRLSKKLDIYDLAKAIGHTDLSKLMIYYRKTAAEIADQL